jgi:muconolactone delta-isomerase
MKFLVLWHLEAGRLNPEVIKAVLEQPTYGRKLEEQGKLECRYHVVGRQGGAWIYKVESNEELDRLLAMAPVFNFAKYEVLPLAEMTDAGTIAGKRA